MNHGRRVIVKLLGGGSNRFKSLKKTTTINKGVHRIDKYRESWTRLFLGRVN